MTNLYVITRIFTFLGTANRALLEHIVCRLCRIPAEDIRSFRNDELCGHIEHEFSPKLSHSFLMCWLPFTVNFLLGCCALLSGSFLTFYVGDVSKTSIAFLWVGFSLICNCAPAFEDALLFRDCLFGSKNILVKIVLAPFFAVAYASAFLERYSITFVLSIAFAVVFPHIVALVFPALHTVVQMFIS